MASGQQKTPCTLQGKVKYATDAEALLALTDLKSKYRHSKKGKWSTYYLCEHCDWWHLTSRNDPLPEPQVTTKRPNERRPMATDTVKIVNLTRKLATELSKVIPEYQRTKNDRWIRGLAADMDAGRWQLSDSAIVVVRGKDGKPKALENGQNRVFARLAAKKNNPCPVIILNKSREDIAAYLVTDTGRGRKFSDYLKGIGVKDYTSIAAVITRCALIDGHPDGHLGQNDTALVSQSKLAEWWEQADQDLLIECTKLAVKVGKVTKGPRTPIAAIAYLGSRDFDKGVTFDFFEAVGNRVEVDHGDGLRDASALLRDTFATWSLNRHRTQVPKRVAWYTIVKAYHFGVLQERKGVLKFAVNEKALSVVPEWMEALEPSS